MLQLWDKHLTANTQFHDHSCPGCTIPAAQLPEPEVWNRSGSLPTEPIQKILHGTWQTIEIHAGVQTTGFQNVYINKVQKSILMQLANEQSTNDTVSSSSSTQQQRFGLRKGHPYNLSQTPIQVWLNRPCVNRNARNEWPCRPTANASGTHLPKQPSKFLSTQVVFLIQLRYISSLLATLVLSMLRQTFLSKKPQTHFFIADWLVISYLCFNSQKKLG